MEKAKREGITEAGNIQRRHAPLEGTPHAFPQLF